MQQTPRRKAQARHARGRRVPEEKVDASVDMTFPASDAPAPGHATSTEPPARPLDRNAPVITKEEIEAAAKGSAEGPAGRAGPTQQTDGAEEVCPACSGTGRVKKSALRQRARHQARLSSTARRSGSRPDGKE